MFIASFIFFEFSKVFHFIYLYLYLEIKGEIKYVIINISILIYNICMSYFIIIDILLFAFLIISIFCIARGVVTVANSALTSLS